MNIKDLVYDFLSIKVFIFISVYFLSQYLTKLHDFDTNISYAFIFMEVTLLYLISEKYFVTVQLFTCAKVRKTFHNPVNLVYQDYSKDYD